MKMIEKCLQLLNQLFEELTYIEGKDNRSEGYNCAIDCLKDGLNTRIELITEQCEEHDDDSEYCATTVIGEMLDLFKVIDECSESIDVKIKEGYNLAVSDFTIKTKPIVLWLLNFIKT